MYTTSVLAFGLFMCAGILPVKSSQKWSYIGATGPLYWHELFPHACGGKSQSPIDIRPEQTMYNPDLKEFALWYDPPKPDSRMYIKNNGHTVQVDLEGEFYVTNGGLPNVYKAAQFHFHWGDKVHQGSEHLVDGQASPIEMHVVTYNHDLYSDITEAVTQPGGLAVLGVLFQITEKDNPHFDYVTRGMKYIQNPEKTAKIELPLFSLRDLLPDDMSRYYRYNGSLTTPGCFETVIWTVFDKMQTISYKQMESFRKLLQFRRKHHKQDAGSDTTNDHHKRTMPGAHDHRESNAKAVLDELGIRGKDSKFERELLKDHLSHTNPKSDTENIVTENGQDRFKRSEVSYLQDNIVNNFRPVQPINGRIVSRSFKLRDPIALDKQEKLVTEVKYKAVHSGEKDKNSASNVSAPLSTLCLSVAIAAFKALFH